MNNFSAKLTETYATSKEKRKKSRDDDPMQSQLRHCYIFSRRFDISVRYFSATFPVEEKWGSNRRRQGEISAGRNVAIEWWTRIYCIQTKRNQKGREEAQPKEADGRWTLRLQEVKRIVTTEVWHISASLIIRVLSYYLSSFINTGFARSFVHSWALR